MSGPQTNNETENSETAADQLVGVHVEQVEDSDEEYGPWQTKIKRQVNKGKKPSFGTVKNNNMVRGAGPNQNLRNEDRERGMQFNARSSSSKKTPHQAGQGNQKLQVLASSYFQDPAGHNICSDLQDDAEDSFIDLEACENVLNRGKRSRLDSSRDGRRNHPK
ncbi:hypothetical protein M5689_010901 [Euphorbia peplus]|nr:hypothetical protein M5689_010901 [Euphorbia peplus]